MSTNIGLANRRLQPLGHLSDGGNTYAFGTSASNAGSESAESAESRHQRGGPESGPTRVPAHVIERPSDTPWPTPPPPPAVTRDDAKSGAGVVPKGVTPEAFAQLVAACGKASPAKPKEKLTAIADPLLKRLRDGVR